jgi:hypothetical protein
MTAKTLSRMRHVRPDHQDRGREQGPTRGGKRSLNHPIVRKTVSLEMYVLQYVLSPLKPGNLGTYPISFLEDRHGVEARTRSSVHAASSHFYNLTSLSCQPLPYRQQHA